MSSGVNYHIQFNRFFLIPMMTYFPEQIEADSIPGTYFCQIHVKDARNSRK